jgi:hypothetical protein
MSKMSKPDYQAKVKLLTNEEKERLLSRMNGKLPRRLEKDKISQEEALAIQMEVEDEHLQEWRKVMQKLKKAEVAPEASKQKSKAAAKPEATDKPKAAAKSKVAAKTEAAPAAKAAVKVAPESKPVAKSPTVKAKAVATSKPVKEAKIVKS